MSKALDRLLGTGGSHMPQQIQHSNRSTGVRQVPLLVIDIERLRPDPDNVRREVAEIDIEEMAASLQELGQQQPIKVRWDATQQLWVIVQLTGICFSAPPAHEY
jgi:ParB family chromosome partitioning protein